MGVEVVDPKMRMIWENVKNYCELNGMTQNCFASKVNVSSVTLRSMIKGGIPSKKILMRIAEEIGVSLEMLVTQDLFKEEVERASTVLAENARNNLKMYCIVEQMSKDMIAANTGVSKTTFAKISSGGVVKKSTMVRIADAIGIPVETLYASTEDFFDIVWTKESRSLSQEILIACAKAGISKEEFAKMTKLSRETILKVTYGHMPKKENEQKIRAIMQKLEENGGKK